MLARPFGSESQNEKWSDTYVECWICIQVFWGHISIQYSISQVFEINDLYSQEFMQINFGIRANYTLTHNVNSDGIAGSGSSGLLSSLLGVGCECEGYSIRIVGHSLGGAIAALLGLRVCHFLLGMYSDRFPFTVCKYLIVFLFLYTSIMWLFIHFFDILFLVRGWRIWKSI